MSILTDALPELLMVDGEVRLIHWDHRAMLQIDELLGADMPDEERGAQILTLFYGSIPMAVEKATQAMLWFFRCGKEPKGETSNETSLESVRPDFSYQQDADFIFAAFLDQYGIDLTETNLHWWKFRALFDALKPDHTFMEVRKCRSIKLKDVPKESIPYYKAMKKLYALPLPEREEKERDELMAALMGDGNVMGVLYADEES